MKTLIFFYKKNIIFFIFLFLYCAYSKNYTGQFAWKTITQSNLDLIETVFFQPNQFYYGRENLYFGEQDTIFWIYRFDQKLVFKPKFIVVLYSVINSPQPVEIDLRVVQPEFQDNFYFIRQMYFPLEQGKYILKIAREDTQIPFDSVEFFVLDQKEIKQISGPIVF